MRILYILADPMQWNNGCWYDRFHTPGLELQRIGHEVKSLIVGKSTGEEWINWADVAIFGRWYHQDVTKLMERFQTAGKTVVYEMDDNLWAVPPINHTSDASKSQGEAVERMLKLADVVTTTTPELRKVLLKHNKNVFVCPNAVNFGHYTERRGDNEKLRVAYSLSVTHHEDIEVILPVIKDLQQKHNFSFIVQGICAQPLAAEFYAYNFLLNLGVMGENQNTFYKKGLETIHKIYQLDFEHVPFYPPELHARVMREVNADIGLCPLTDNEFNKSKSCQKFYQYAALGSATLASDVMPYKKEVNYCAKNTYKDWYNKLERLLTEEEFRQETYQKQRKWVLENRNIQKIVEECWLPAFSKGR